MATVKSGRKNGSSVRIKKSGNRRSLVFVTCIIAAVFLLFVVVGALFIFNDKASGVPGFGEGKNRANNLIEDDGYLYRQPGNDERKYNRINSRARANGKNDSNSGEQKIKTPEYGVKDKDYLDKLIKSR